MLTGPNGDPDGLLPKGVPGLVKPNPLGTIEKGKALVEVEIIYSTATSANSFSARAFSRLLLASSNH